MNSNVLFDGIDDEEITRMQAFAHLYRVLTTIYVTGSVEPTIITENIYRHFNQQIPVELIAEIVNEYVPIIQDPLNGFMLNGKLTSEAIEIAIEHNRVFQN